MSQALGASREDAALQRDLRRAGFVGDVIGRDDARFEASRRVWNGLIDRRPSVIVQCLTPRDVATSVGFMSSRVAGVSVRGGGHSVAGLAVGEDVPMIDLSNMRTCVVEGRSVRAQGGARLSDLDTATLQLGRLCPSGVVSRTGLGGLALGGGYGWFSRVLGLTCDQLASAAMVTASGETVEVSPTDNPELYWAIRGGGGNFGIVTEFVLRHHPARHGTLITLTATGNALDVLLNACGQHLNASTPRELTVRLAMTAQGRGARLSMQALWLGSSSTMPSWVTRLSDVTGTESARREVTARDLQTMLKDAEPDGFRYYCSSRNIVSMEDPGLGSALVELAAEALPHSSVDITHLGGAVDDPDPATSAFPSRGVAFLVSASGCWPNPADDHSGIAWARSLHDRVAPWSSGGTYVNYMAKAGPSDVREVYGAARYEALSRTKATYDPNNFFAQNQNIQPRITTEGSSS